MRILNRVGFKTRIFFSLILLCIPLMLCVSLILYQYLYDGAKQRMMQSMQKALNETMIHLELIIDDTENLSRSILYNDEVQEAMQATIDGDSLVSLTSVSNYINSSIAYRDHIDSIVLASLKSTFFSTEKATSDIISMESIKQKWWYQNDSVDDFPFLWIPEARQNIFYGESFNNDTMLIRKITSKKDFKTKLGSMMIYLDKNYINNFLDQIQIGETTNIWVIDEKNNIMFERKSPASYDTVFSDMLNDIYSLKLEQNSTFRYVDGIQYLISWSRFPSKDWYILGVVPLHEINQNFIIIKQQIIIMLLFLVFISLLASFIISSSMSKPIKYLAKTMDKYGENTDKKDNPERLFSYRQRKDEIGTIFNSYIQLTNRIETLIKEIYLKDLEKKDAEMASLESQIKPHFLYNTLDSINWLAMASGQDKISDMVTALSDTFRLSLRKSNSPYISFEDEIQHIQSYLLIQQNRYGERLQCKYSILTETMNLYTLRFILQPLVENSLEHGIDKIEGTGEIEIRAALEKGKLVICIINDGLGIDLNKVNQILSSKGIQPFTPKDDNTCYGIKNINNRIQMVHGNDFGLEYAALADNKTLCRVILPLITPDQLINIENTKEIQ